LSAPQANPLPFFETHAPPDAQYSVAAHEPDVHASAQAAPLQPLGQACVPLLRQVPPPLQVFARVAVVPLHVAAAHSVPAGQ
jgi:hypothetical protein